MNTLSRSQQPDRAHELALRPFAAVEQQAVAAAAHEHRRQPAASARHRAAGAGEEQRQVHGATVAGRSRARARCVHGARRSAPSRPVTAPGRVHTRRALQAPWGYERLGESNARGIMPLRSTRRGTHVSADPRRPAPASCQRRSSSTNAGSRRSPSPPLGPPRPCVPAPRCRRPQGLRRNSLDTQASVVRSAAVADPPMHAATLYGGKPLVNPQAQLFIGPRDRPAAPRGGRLAPHEG